MKRAHRLWLVIFCAVAYSVATGHLSPTERLYAQANSDVYNDERVYIASYISVDGSYNLYATSSMTVLFGEQWDGIELFGYVDGDGSYSGSDYANGVDNAEVSLESSGPVTPGHTYTLESDGYACISYNGNGGEGDFYDCEYDPVGSAYATVYVLPPPPLIASLSPSSVNQGDQGTLTITGTNFIETAADQLTLTFSGTYNPFTLTSAPSTCTSTCTATFSYEFSGYPPGTYSLWLANDEAESEPVSFTVALPIQSALPLDPCAVVSSSQVGFTSIVPTGTSSGSGTLTVSFSGAAFAMVNQSVSYGPYSTPSSIAASMAALITRNYARYGLTAKAFGRNVIYSGTATTSSGSGTLGLVTNVFSGNGGVSSSFIENPSLTAANEAGLACESAPPPPPTTVCAYAPALRGHQSTCLPELLWRGVF